MSNAHKKSNLLIAKKLVPVDKDTEALFHYDITANDVLHGIEPSENSVYTLRPFEGKFGGGIAVESGTTNLFNQDPTGKFSVRSGKDLEVITLTDTEVIYKNSFTGELWNYAGVDIPVVSGGVYTSSVDVYVSGDFNGDYTKMIGLESMGATVFNYDMSKKGTWQRFERTFTASSDNKHRFLMYPCPNNSSATNGYVLFRNPQTERRSDSSSFINGTRANGLLKYPKELINTEEGTISFWLNIQSETSQAYPIFSSGVDGGFDLLYQNQNTNLYLRGYSTSSASTQLRPNPIKLKEWNHIAISWKNGEFFGFYKNGKLDVSSTSPQNWGSYFNSNGTGFFIGSGIRNNSNIIIDELRIDNIMRTQEEIESWYISDLPFYPKGIYRLAY